MDVLQDCFGLFISITVTPESVGLFFFVISSVMLYHDVYAIYLVGLEKPFLFFDSAALEKLSFWVVMSGDFIYDGLIMLMFLGLVTFTNDDNFMLFATFLVVTVITFCLDIYQAILFFTQYEQGQLTPSEEEKFKAIEGDDYDI